jgi:hypothetical protein
LTEFEVREYDDTEIARLASIGRTPDTDPTVAVDGPGMTIFFQETSRPKKERGRIHFDLVGGLRRSEVDRIVALGGSIKAVRDGLTVMQDPRATSSASRTPATRDRRPIDQGT